jgi:hypothetical protein
MDENTNRLKMVFQNGIDYHKGQKLLHLTLTLKKGSQNNLQLCFEKFIKRVQQLNPNEAQALDPEYWNLSRMGAIYGKKEDWNMTFQLDYFSVNVEGQYMHIYYYGPFFVTKIDFEDMAENNRGFVYY